MRTSHKNPALLLSLLLALCLATGRTAFFEPKSSQCSANVDLINHCCACTDGNTKITTTPRYDITPYNYPPLPLAYENFGSTVKMSGKLVVADNNPDYLPDQTLEGDTLVHVMEYSETLGSWLHTVITSPGDALSGQGHTLSISQNFILVGNPSRDPANVGLFVRTSSPPWSLSLILNEPSIRSEFGYSLAVEEDLQRLFVSDPSYMNELGRVYVYFTYSDIIIDTLNHPYAITSEGSRFGHCISVSDDLALVSSPWDDINGFQEIGSVHLFQQESGGTKWRYVKSFHPPSPQEGRSLVSGRKFGWSLAFDGGSFFAVGSYSSDSVEIYKQRTQGDALSFYHFQTLVTPYNPTFISRFGFSIDIYGDRIAIGDPNYIVSPSAQGKVFLYEYSRALDEWMSCQTLVDDQRSFHTHFGQSVSLGNARFLCVGAPDTDSSSNGNGKVWVLDLDRSSQCSGCDGIVNSQTVVDKCGICAGDNSSCSGCDSVPNSGLRFDYCGVCGGDNSTCLFSQSIVNMDNPCSFSNSATLQQSQVQQLHFEHEPSGNKVVWSVVSPPSGGQAGLRIFSINAGDFGYVPSVSSSSPLFRVPDALGNYPVDEFELQVRDMYSHSARVRVLIHFPPCIGCDGIADSGTVLDSCGVCGGDNSTCADCFGVPYGNHILDYCMTCTEPQQANRTCLHVIMNMPPPPLQQQQQQKESVFMSSSSEGGNGLVYQIPCGGGFNYYWQTCEPYRIRTHIKWSLVSQPVMGHATIGFHNGNLSYVHDKETHLEDGQEILYIKAIDGYGNVGIGKIIAQITGCTIRGCDGQLGSGVVVDRCGICGGTDECVDCSGIPHGGMVVDVCGICGGTGDTCIAGVQGVALLADPETIPIAVWITFGAVCVLGGGIIFVYFVYFCLRSGYIRRKIHRSRNPERRKVKTLMAQPPPIVVPQTTTTRVTTTTTTTGFPSPLGALPLQQAQPEFVFQPPQPFVRRGAEVSVDV